MTADLLVLLDQLDEARAKATPGEWAQHPADGEYVIGDISDGGESYLDVADTYSFGRETALADAACIVADHNALPKLTAALRAVLAECESAERDVSELLGLRMGLRIASNVSSDTIRDAITAALTPEPVRP